MLSVLGLDVCRFHSANEKNVEYLVFIFPLGCDMHKYACIALNLKKHMHSQYELDTSQFQKFKVKP